MTPEEREQALRDELETCRRLLRTVRCLANCGELREFEGETWLKRIMNIDLQYDPTTLAARQRT